MPPFSPSGNTPPGNLFSLAQIQHLVRTEFSRAQRYSYPLACLMIAVDRLGHTRDLYGYEIKEKILDRVVEMVHAESRSSDFLGRMADERLMLLVPHTEADGVRALAERMLVSVGSKSWPFEGATDLRVTLSVGISDNGSGDAMFYDAMTLASEAALERAIEAGGNRVIFQNP